MSSGWLAVILVGAATVSLKAAGPVFLGRRPLPPALEGAVALVAPVMLVALVVSQTVGGEGRLVLDERIPGVAAAALVIWRGAPVAAAMAVAALVTALLRLAG
ncbi:MAG TPA: AzlD domain-containing protein [Gaiellaceae bacterium]|nr:AzlD domain-containing protein [Gaiellaceae bacterium]